MKPGKTIDQLRIGETAEFTKTVTETDIYLYAGISGDFNPAHVNEVYANNTFFKTRIAHGYLGQPTPRAGYYLSETGLIVPRAGTYWRHHHRTS